MYILCLGLLLVVGLFGGCSYLPKGLADLDARVKERGIASWYGDAFHGETTASGDAYDTKALTGAHRTLPFDTVVKVTNVQNGRQVRIRINDRGPYANGRILDLSHAAAVDLGFASNGTAPVLIEVVGVRRTELGTELASTWSGGALLLLEERASVASLGAEEELGTEGASDLWLVDLDHHMPHPRRVSPGDMILERRLRREADPHTTDHRADWVSGLEFA